MNQREYYTHKIAKLVVAPLDLTVQRKRNLSVLAQCGFYTVTYPVSASLAFGYLLIAKKGSNNDPINMRTGLVVKAPYLFFSELLDPQNKYFEVGNKHALIPADDSNPRVRLYQNGSPTTCEGLDVIYPDGLYLQIFPELTIMRKLDLDIAKLVDRVDERGIKWSAPRNGVRICLEPDSNPQMRFLSTIYRDAPFSLQTNPALKETLEVLVV